MRPFRLAGKFEVGYPLLLYCGNRSALPQDLRPTQTTERDFIMVSHYPKQWRGPALGLAAAALFGASTPFGKMLLGQMDPQWLAGLLYLGSRIGLGAWSLIQGFTRKGRSSEAAISRSDLPWIAGAIFTGAPLPGHPSPA